MDPEIRALAERLLDKETIAKADEFSDLLLRDQHMRWHVIEEMRSIIGMKPKDPMSFIYEDLNKLPRETRNIVWYAGEYIDRFIKMFAYRAGKYFMQLKFLRRRALRSPMGDNLKRLGAVIPEPLFTDLRMFNDAIYAPARAPLSKKTRSARDFTAQEAIFICFIMKNLEQKIRPTAEAIGL